MKATKTIAELIDNPRADIDVILLEITDEHIEITGSGDTQLEVQAGKYQYVSLSDTLFQNSRANNVSSFRSNVMRCQFINSQLTGLQLPEGSFKHVIFKNCRMNLTNFRRSAFENCVFEDCDLNEADFGGSSLKNVLFTNCQLDGTDFSHCKNDRFELENTSLAEVVGVSGFKGASISEQNLIELAPLLARELDITIK